MKQLLLRYNNGFQKLQSHLETHYIDHLGHSDPFLTKASHGSAGKKTKDSLLGLQVLSMDSHNYIYRLLDVLQPRQSPALTPCFGTVP